ncbi:unnamed protein product [Arabidopsis thaliana]|uniref:Uncharacterized protein n=1 Tax=Arabidopsis thaliana TaxID=3702 RepID=A0A654EM71_ARATH|nr:unnamed protein product [Arabidopsis thaliana]
MVNYVNGLDVEGDILFLKACGWDAPREITVPFMIYTYFLKKAVQHHLTIYDMAVIALNHRKPPKFNLCKMVLEDNAENSQEDELFLRKAYEKIDSRLEEYPRLFFKKNRW